MPPPTVRELFDKIPKARPWLREGVVRRVSPHYSEVENSRGMILPMLLVLLVLISAVLVFIILQVNPTPGPSVIAAPTTGVAPTPVPILAVPTVGRSPTQAVVKHKVQSGDTLSGIALKYGITVPALMAENNLTSNLIRPGDELIIPPAK